MPVATPSLLRGLTVVISVHHLVVGEMTLDDLYPDRFNP